jgi:geranylgeranyl pyrophosphate synthase
MWALQALSKKKGERLASILKKPSKSKADVKEALSLLSESGAPEKALAYAQKRVESALRELECLPKSDAQRSLRQLASYITKRER